MAIDFETLLSTAQGKLASVSGKTAIFYSGYTGTAADPVYNSDVARQCAADFSDSYYTISDTPAGDYLITQNLPKLVEDGTITSDQEDQLWQAVSKNYADQAQGNVLAFLAGGNVSADNVFVSTEYQSILANPKIPSINGVLSSTLPSDAMTATNILGALSKCYDPDDNLPPSASAPVTPLANSDLVIDDALVPIGGTTPLPNIQEASSTGVNGVELAAGLGLATAVGTLLFTKNPGLALKTGVAASTLLFGLIPSTASAGTSGTTPENSFQQQGDQSVANALSIAPDLAAAGATEEALQGTAPTSNVASFSPGQENLIDIQNFLSGSGMSNLSVTAQIDPTTSDTISIGSGSGGGIQIDTVQTSPSGSTDSILYQGPSSTSSFGVDQASVVATDISNGDTSNIDATNISAAGIIENVSDTVGTITASQTVSLSGSDTIASNTVLSGVTLNGFGPSIPSFSPDGGIEIQNFDVDQDYGSGFSLSAIGYADGSLSITATGPTGTWNVISYSPDQITGDQLTNFNYGQSAKGGIEFDRFSSDSSTLLSDTVAILDGGSVELNPTVLVTESVVDLLFSGKASILKLDSPFYAYRSILNFRAGDTIDLVGLQTSVDQLNGPTTAPADFYALDVSESTGSLSIQILNIQQTETVDGRGNTIENSVTSVAESNTILFSPYLGYAPSGISTSTDGAGGINVFASSIACYVAGTHIVTQNGEVKVEDLAIGDIVQAQFTGSASVKWIGHRRIDCYRNPKPRTVWPVRVAAGAFGEKIPHRDLWLSPDHAVYVDGVLIPIRLLVNGETIKQEERNEVTYWHVELEQHDVILAEGLPCESYLDTGNRAAFANCHSIVQLHPELTSEIREARGCAPLVVAGDAIEAARSRILDHAQFQCRQTEQGVRPECAA